MRSPDVYKALDLPEICTNRASRPCCRDETSSVVAALDLRGATLPSPAAFVVHIRFLGACPKGGLKSNHLESGIPPGFCSFKRPALAAARRKASVLEIRDAFLTLQAILAIPESITSEREPGEGCRIPTRVAQI